MSEETQNVPKSIGDNNSSSTDSFEDFWKTQKYQDGYSYAGAKIAWNHQQKTIDEQAKEITKLKAINTLLEDGVNKTLGMLLGMTVRYDLYTPLDAIIKKIDKLKQGEK